MQFELKQLIFDYNVIADEEEKVVFKKEAEDLLDRLSVVIWKLERLKNKIKIDNIDKYDDNYIYTLIEGYLSDFKDKKFVSEIKDSPLYVLISEKIEELDYKRENLNDKLEEKKDNLAEKEQNFEKLKSKFYDFEKLRMEFQKFQEEQEYFYYKTREKMKDAVTVSEKIKTEIEALDLFSFRMLKMMSMSMLFPGNRAGISMVMMSKYYIDIINKIRNPKTITKKYKVVEVKDYSEEIERNLASISNTSSLLYDTDKQLQKMAQEIRDDFSEYIGIFPECDKLLYHLEQMRFDILEKKFEIDKIKEKQEVLLSKNNSKVLTRGEYPM